MKLRPSVLLLHRLHHLAVALPFLLCLALAAPALAINPSATPPSAAAAASSANDLHAREYYDPALTLSTSYLPFEAAAAAAAAQGPGQASALTRMVQQQQQSGGSQQLPRVYLDSRSGVVADWIGR